MSNNPQKPRLSQLPASPSKQMITVEEADGHLSYNYTSSGLTNDPLQELHQRFLGLLFQFTFTALLLYAAVLALTYISASTDQYGSPPHCLLPDLRFDGWEYLLVCARCEEGFLPGSGVDLCVPV